MSKLVTTADFIARSTLIHSGKFDYSKAVYNGNHSKVLIICPTHGVFEQEAGSHLKGVGCSRCYGNEVIDTHEFIHRAMQKHGEKYTYEQTVYRGNKQKVVVGCSQHGPFSIRANDLLSGYGCKQCGRMASASERTYSLAEFIERARYVHHNKYDYSAAVYTHGDEKICVVCPSHGAFWPTPNNHINNHTGCPKCLMSKGEKQIQFYLDSHSYQYQYNVPLPGCVQQKRLRFDFVLPNIRTCIEFDGKQHFEPIAFFGGWKTFQQQVSRDAKKTQLCLLHNWTLIRVNYRDLDKIGLVLEQKL